jgi:Carboxypeptidase regulatory-like domain
MSGKAFILVLISAACMLGQSTGALSGVVSDSSGAVIPNAQVKVSDDAGNVKFVTSGEDGAYHVTGLRPGKYTVETTLAGMTQGEPAAVAIGDGTNTTLNLVLRLTLEKQVVTVQESAGPQVSTDPASNAATLTVSGDALDALSDDPDDLQADLQALAGPSAGPNAGQIYIDGFTAGDATLPNKDAIREIRINQNPFSPEFDAIGYGRTEILTKPGKDRYRGQTYFNYGNAYFNSRNPYAQEKSPFDLKEYGGNFGGPLNKSSSFFLDVDERDINNGSVVDAITLDPKTLAIIDPYTAVFSSPLSRLRISPRIDYQLGANNTLMFRYALTRSSNTDTGAGGFSLASTAYDLHLVEHAFQATETAVLNSKMIDETRFQFLHQHNAQTASDQDPSLVVVNAFTGGGATNPSYYYIHHHYEVQNYLSILSGAHSWKMGVRLRAVAIQDSTHSNFNGTYVFGGAYAPILNLDDPVVPSTPCNPIVATPGCETISSIQQYQRTLLFEQMGFSPAQVRLLGGGATQFSINQGNPLVRVGQVDAGLFVGDDWRLKPNFTLSLGLRYEIQTNIHSGLDFAPRVGFAWAPGPPSKTARPKTVIRGGFGIFYYRFNEQNILIAQRFNGITQQQYVVVNPDTYPAIPSSAMLEDSGAPQAIHTVSPLLQAPYVIQSAMGVERQLPRNTTVAVTYTNSHGLHQLLSRNINAPLPGTYSGPGTGIYPYPDNGPIYEMESGGLYNQNQLVTNINSRISQNISLFGYYVLSYVDSNTDGINTYPANQYNMAGEYAPAATDIRHRAAIGGSLTTKWNIRFSPLIVAQSGAPFDIITSQDVYGDTVLTARPGIATNPNAPGVIATSYGLLDPNPTPGEKILPRDFGRGPGFFSMDLRVAKTFGLGPARKERSSNTSGGGGGGGLVAPTAGPAGRGGIGGFDNGGGGGGGDASSTGHRYNLTVSLSARNLLNHVNPGPIIGNINSPLFGQSNQIAGGFGAFTGNASNRRLELQLRLSF